MMFMNSFLHLYLIHFFIYIYFKIGERIVHESVENVTLERQTLYCVPVPGENDWVSQVSSSTMKAFLSSKKIFVFRLGFYML